MRAIIYVAISLVGMWLIRITLPLLQLLFSPLYMMVEGLATMVFIVGVPFFAYALSKGEVTKKQLWICLLFFAGCLILWCTSPHDTIVEDFYVAGRLEEPYDYAGATREYHFYCFEDAEIQARSLYKDRSNWAKDEEGKFVECDVEIRVVQRTPALAGINQLLGTTFGVDTYSTTIRMIDSREDPLVLTDSWKDELLDYE